MSNQDTKEKILDVAERLFANEGYVGTSIRHIAMEAGVNLAAAHYHFGSKKELFAAVFHRTFEPVTEARFAMLDEAEKEAGDGPLDIEKVLMSFALPPLRMLTESTAFAKLVYRARVETHPDLAQAFHEEMRETLERYMKAFRRALPGKSVVDLYWNAVYMVGAFGHAILRLAPFDDTLKTMMDEMIPGITGEKYDPEAEAERLVAFCAAGLRAGSEPGKGE